jgi:hypothetical protein
MISQFGFDGCGTPIYEQKPGHFGKNNPLIVSHPIRNSRVLTHAVNQRKPQESDTRWRLLAKVR